MCRASFWAPTLVLSPGFSREDIWGWSLQGENKLSKVTFSDSWMRQAGRFRFSFGSEVLRMPSTVPISALARKIIGAEVGRLFLWGVVFADSFEVRCFPLYQYQWSFSVKRKTWRIKLSVQCVYLKYPINWDNAWPFRLNICTGELIIKMITLTSLYSLWNIFLGFKDTEIVVSWLYLHKLFK